MTVERRAIGAALATDGMLFTGTAAPFDTATYIGVTGKGGFHEKIAPGAFSRSLRTGRDVLFSIDHDPSRLLARRAAGTLRLNESRTGLEVEADLPPTQLGRDTATMVKMGNYRGMSFTFHCIRDSWAPTPGGHSQTRTLHDCELLELGPVHSPQYASTTAAVRSALDTAPAEVRSAVLAATESTMSPAITPYRSTSTLRRALAVQSGQDWPAGHDEAEYRAAFSRWLRATAQGREPGRDVMSVLLAELERRDLGVGTTTAGGFLVPQEFYDTLVVAMRYSSPVRELARTWVSDTGADAPLPQVDDTANVGAQLAENVADAALDAALTSRTLKAWMYQSQLVKASWQLANDSAFPLEEVLAELMGDRIGRIQNTHFTTGNGTTQPEGFAAAGVVGVTLATGNTTTFSTGAGGYAALVALTQSVDPAYRRDPSCAWQMNDATWTAVQGLADTGARPLFLARSDDVGIPILLGWPVHINPDMAAMAANAKTIAFGAWRKHYVVRDVVGLTVKELRERFADQMQRGYYGYLRSDGRIADPKAVRLLAQSAT